MKKSPFALFLILSLLFFTGCKKESIETVILQKTEYPILPFNGSDISGKATFTEDSNGSTFILLQLTGSNTFQHPAYIRFNSATDGGENAITLEVCTCQIGKTLVTKLDNGDKINYDGLVKLNGHIAILTSTTNNTVVATANIGTNAN